MPNFILLPRAADELEIPFVSSGGQADGRSLVASLAFGADGMNMDTLHRDERSARPENVKQATLHFRTRRLVMRPLRNTERVMTNAGVEHLLEKERELGSDIKFEDIINEVAGVYPKSWSMAKWMPARSCGMVAGLIHDIPTVQELMDRIMNEAEELMISISWT